MSDAAQAPQLEVAVPAPSGKGVTSRLLRGASVYAAANFGVRLLSFALVPLYTRYLAPAEFGQVNLAEVVAIVAVLVFSLGVEGALRRLFFDHAGDLETQRRYVSTTLRFGTAVILGGTAASLAAGPWLLRTIAPHFQVSFFPYVALAIGTAAAARILEFRLALYQIEEKAGRYAVLSTIFFLSTAAAVVFYLIIRRAGAVGLLTGRLMAALAIAAVAVYLMRHYLAGGWDARFLRPTLAVALPLIPHQLMALFLIAADRLILERYRSLEEIGLYSLAYSLGMAMSLFTASLAQAWSPIYFDTARSAEGPRVLGRVSTGLALLLAGVACFGALISRDFVRLVMDPRYQEAGRLVPWIIGGYLLHGLFSLFHLSALQVKKTNLLWMASTVAVAVNVGLNFLLVPRWGMYGSAWATVAGYGCEAALMYVGGQRVFPLLYSRWRMSASLGMFAGVLAFTQLRSGAWWTVVAGMVVVMVAIALVGGQDLRRALRLLRPGQATR